jgi:hypothetical protein
MKKIVVTEAALKQFEKDHGLDRPLKPGEMHVIHRNGAHSIFNLEEETKKLDDFIRNHERA